MSYAAIKEGIRALLTETQGRGLLVDFADGKRLCIESDGLNLTGDALVARSKDGGTVRIPYGAIAEIGIESDEHEILAVSETPGYGVHLEFRSGRKRTVLGRSIDEAQREVGCVGDKVLKRKFELVTGQAEPPPLAPADVRSFPK